MQLAHERWQCHVDNRDVEVDGEGGEQQSGKNQVCFARCKFPSSSLRDLEQGGVVYREDAPPPIATTAFRLTERGEQLKPVMRELGRYGVPLMVETVESDAFRSHWLALPAGIYLSDQEPRCTAHRN